MEKFITGKIYKTVSICDSDCILRYKVIKRTACTVTLKALGNDWEKTRTLRINKGASEYFGKESVYPWGHYSMCPVLTA